MKNPDPGEEIMQFLNKAGRAGEFKIPAHYGSGVIKKILLGDEIQIHSWDCLFTREFSIPARKISFSTRPRYHLVYHSFPDSLHLVNPGVPGINMDKLWNTIFMAGDSGTNFSILPGRRVQCLYIGFTKNWLDRQTGASSEFLSKINGEKNGALIPFFLFETANALEKKMIRDLEQFQHSAQHNPLFTKSRVVTLLHEFIHKISARNFMATPSFNHSFEISKIEKSLTAALGGALPPIRQLAKECCLSESTLKRGFKKAYGVSISQYFLQKKMDYAFRLIQEKNGNVSEIACMLGYEKVSRFIAMFKKHKGLSPGTLIKSISL